MNRNNETFSQAPTLRMSRSKIPLHQNIKTTFNTGFIIPFFTYLDILPGDTFSLDYSMIVRQTTAQTPTMDNAYCDVYFFAVPWRILWQHFKEFMGENTQGAWSVQTEYVIPQFTTPTGGAAKGTIMDYMGIPINVPNLAFSAMGIRAYVFTYNEWFRDQNLIAPAMQYDDDTDREASNTVTELGGVPFKAAKFHDYFTSALPAPQKGDAVVIPIGTQAPVSGGDVVVKQGIMPGVDGYSRFVSKSEATNASVDTNPRSGQPITGNYAMYLGANGDSLGYLDPNGTLEIQGAIADLSQAVAATVNALRFSVAEQRIAERNARGGTRLREQIKAAFGVSNGDARMQIPEYLGGERFPLQLLQVAQTSATDGGKALGDLAAYGHTANVKHAFTKSFTEWCVLLGLLVVRTDQSYSQGLNRMWSRRRRYDVYDPALAYLGEQEVKNKELFAQGNDTDNETYGFQERFGEYRHLPNMITGAFRPTYAQSLDFWHYGMHLENLPVLSQEWIEETTANVDRTLTVTSAVEDQFLADIQIKIDATRVMPSQAIPGLMDHF